MRNPFNICTRPLYGQVVNGGICSPWSPQICRFATYHEKYCKDYTCRSDPPESMKVLFKKYAGSFSSLSKVANATANQGNSSSPPSPSNQGNVSSSSPPPSTSTYSPVIELENNGNVSKILNSSLNCNLAIKNATEFSKQLESSLEAKLVNFSRQILSNSTKCSAFPMKKITRLKNTVVSKLANISQEIASNFPLNCSSKVDENFKADLLTHFNDTFLATLNSSRSQFSKLFKRHMSQFKMEFSDEFVSKFQKQENFFLSLFYNISQDFNVTVSLVENLQSKLSDDFFFDEMSLAIQEIRNASREKVRVHLTIDSEAVQEILSQLKETPAALPPKNSTFIDLSNSAFTLIAKLQNDLQILESSFQSLAHLKVLSQMHNCNCTCFS